MGEDLFLEATRGGCACVCPQMELTQSVSQCGCQLVFQSYISSVCLHVSQNGADMVGLWVLACLRRR